MATVFDLDWFLDRAERDFLLLGKEEHSFKLRITGAIRTDPRKFEREIAAYPEISITSFADRKVDGVKMGIPAEIRFNSEFLLKKRPQLSEIKRVISEAKESSYQIDIDAFLRKNISEVKKKSDILISAVKTAEYLLENAENLKGLYPRQIPHGQSTKLLLNDTLVRRILSFYFGSPQLSVDEVCDLFDLKQKPSYFHFYADKIVYDRIELSNHHCIITESNAHRFLFSASQSVLIVENEETFHAAHGCVPGVVIFGNGDKAANLKFLKTAFKNTKVFYWGDIDKAGYEILANVREIFEHVIPLGMGNDVIERFWHLKQHVEKCNPLNDIQILSAEYRRVCGEGIQIEQEQLPVEEITMQLRPDAGPVVQTALTTRDHLWS